MTRNSRFGIASVSATIVALVIAGSLWIMDNLNENMMPMHQMMQMQR